MSPLERVNVPPVTVRAPPLWTQSSTVSMVQVPPLMVRYLPPSHPLADGALFGVRHFPCLCVKGRFLVCRLGGESGGCAVGPLRRRLPFGRLVHSGAVIIPLPGPPLLPPGAKLSPVDMVTEALPSRWLAQSPAVRLQRPLC